MEFYFGAVDLAEFGEIVNLDTVFENKGKYYWYKVTADDEGITIEDTCGRYIPIERDSLKDFSLALFGITSFYKAHEDAAALIERRMVEIDALLAYFEAENA